MIYVAAGNYSHNASTIRFVNKIFRHTGYNDLTQENDIALVEVQWITFSSFEIITIFISYFEHLVKQTI